jgi:mono/diheme cytochrome c family protein
MWRAACLLLLAALGLLACAQVGRRDLLPLPVETAEAPLPARLHDTGLYAGDRLRPDLVAFTPQYPLWSDGAAKRRWLYLPPGTAVDASRPDEWRFPAGTRLWKEFSHGGRPVETRYVERLRDGRWRFAAYVWNAEGTEARLVPQRGIPALPVAAAPGGRYAIPSRGDCLACHGSAPAPVLGFAALQLSDELPALATRGVLQGLPATWLRTPPRIAGATALERAALGTLHGNCAHCHNTSGNRVPLPLTLAQRAADPQASRDEVLRAAADAPARYQPVAGGDARIAVPGQPDASLLVQRMASRDPRRQMPPLGTQQVDAEGLALVRRWIASDLHQPR